MKVLIAELGAVTVLLPSRNQGGAQQYNGTRQDIALVLSQLEISDSIVRSKLQDCLFPSPSTSDRHNVHRRCNVEHNFICPLHLPIATMNHGHPTDTL